MRLSSLSGLLANVKELFAQYDVNKNESLSKQELAAMLQKLGFSPKEVPSIFEQADINRDGGISEMEFYQAILLTINAPKDSRWLHVVVVIFFSFADVVDIRVAIIFIVVNNVVLKLRVHSLIIPIPLLSPSISPSSFPSIHPFLFAVKSSCFSMTRLMMKTWRCGSQNRSRSTRKPP